MSKKVRKDRQVGGGLAKTGRMLKKRREDLRISYAKASHLSGLSTSTIRRIEDGDAGVSLGVLMAYLDSLGAGSLFMEALNNSLRGIRESEGEIAFAREMAEIKKSMLNERL